MGGWGGWGGGDYFSCDILVAKAQKWIHEAGNLEGFSESC